ncbi:LacI family transcriptional regulator [Bosea sp. LjRoot90]|uniref:LacI family DNA-binding transcriptional regulator n=1 Tax=Bosea sp. LjRoot90 TaxID=3342342 RepID=UPI003ECF6C3A
MSDSPSKPRDATVLDVAREAGVSKATAARVLGGYSVTSPAVRDKVMTAARSLNYRPNEVARSMTTGRSRTIGVIVADVENPYFGLAVRGISDVARAEGFDVILANSGEDVERERDAIRMLLGKRVDGLIVTPASVHDTGHLRAVEASGRPIVLLDRYIPSMSVDTVVADDRAAGAAVARRLTEAGHRRIGYVSATACDDPVYRGPHQLHLSTVRDRIEGFLEAAAQAGGGGCERYVRLGVNRLGGGPKIVADLMALPDRPTALIASDNVVALELFKALRALGIAIPRDLSLIAFHDADWTSVTTPSITVIAQPCYELGSESAAALVRRARGDTTVGRRIILQTRLIERESVIPPPR